MDNALFRRREQQILRIRWEASLAIKDAEPAYGSPAYGHAVWHAFLPYLRGGDVEIWANEIENLLIPLMMRDGDQDWRSLAMKLRPLVTALRVMRPGPIYNCGRCY